MPTDRNFFAIAFGVMPRSVAILTSSTWAAAKRSSSAASKYSRSDPLPFRLIAAFRNGSPPRSLVVVSEVLARAVRLVLWPGRGERGARRLQLDRAMRGRLGKGDGDRAPFGNRGEEPLVAAPAQHQPEPTVSRQPAGEAEPGHRIAAPLAGPDTDADPRLHELGEVRRNAPIGRQPGRPTGEVVLWLRGTRRRDRIGPLRAGVRIGNLMHDRAALVLPESIRALRKGGGGPPSELSAGPRLKQHFRIPPRRRGSGRRICFLGRVASACTRREARSGSRCQKARHRPRPDPGGPRRGSLVPFYGFFGQHLASARSGPGLWLRSVNRHGVHR
jgi:hypothetical protein